MKKVLFALIVLSFCASCSEVQKIHVNWATFNIRLENPGDSLNNWEYRKEMVADYVKLNDIDIVGMQEVVYSQLEYLAAALPDYDYVGVCREDGDKKGEATPIFFRSDRFEALASNTFWLSQYPDSIGFIGWDGAYPRIATWVKLRDKSNDRIFMAINTHFDHIGVEARKNAALLIIDKIKEIVGDELAVLTGDFNVGEDSEAYHTITENEFVLLDSHKLAPITTGPAYTWHDFGKEIPSQKEKIDFIFVTKDIEVLSSNIFQEHTYDPEKPETEWGYLSDHNPVMAELAF